MTKKNISLNNLHKKITKYINKLLDKNNNILNNNVCSDISVMSEKKLNIFNKNILNSLFNNKHDKSVTLIIKSNVINKDQEKIVTLLKKDFKLLKELDFDKIEHLQYGGSQNFSSLFENQLSKIEKQLNIPPLFKEPLKNKNVSENKKNVSADKKKIEEKEKELDKKERNLKIKNH